MKTRQVNDIQLEFEFETGNNKKFKVKGIQNNIVYIKKLIIS